MSRPGFLAERVETERIAYALDHRRFPGASSADQHIQVFVEVHGSVAQEPAFPGHGEELGMGFGLQIAVQTDPGVRVEKRLPERFDRDGGHLDEAGGALLLQVVRAVDVRSVQNGKRAVAPVLGVLVLDDRPEPVRRVAHRSRQRAGKQVRMGPDIDSRLSRELSQQSALGGDMGGDAHSAPGLCGFKQFGGVLGARRGRSICVENAAVPDKALQDAVLVRIEQAQEMNAVFRDGLETGERMEVRITRSAHEASRMLDAVVIRDRDDLDAGVEAGFDDRRVVFVFRSEGGRPPVPLKIGERIDLQGAAVEPRTVRKIQCGLHAIREQMRQAGRLRGHLRLSVSLGVSNLIPAPISLVVRRCIARPRLGQPKPRIPSSAWRTGPEPRRYLVES